MRLTGREVMRAVTEAAIAGTPGAELDWNDVANRLNETLAAGLIGRVRLVAPAEAPLSSGRCRICGCVDDDTCVLEREDGYPSLTCAWADPGHTLCTNPDCLAAANQVAAA